LVAVSQGRVIGKCSATPESKDVMSFHDLVVDPAYRDNHVGKALAVRRLQLVRGLPTVQSVYGTAKPGSKSGKLFSELGFTPQTNSSGNSRWVLTLTPAVTRCPLIKWGGFGLAGAAAASFAPAQTPPASDIRVPGAAQSIRHYRVSVLKKAVFRRATGTHSQEIVSILQALAGYARQAQTWRGTAHPRKVGRGADYKN